MIKINNILKQKNLDGIIITSKENRQYFSGFTGSEGTLLITNNKNYIFVDSRYTIQAKQQTKDFEVIEINSTAYKFLEQFTLNIIGFEDKTILHSQFLKLPGNEKIGISKDIDDMRMVKNSDEIAKMQKAADVADKAFLHIVDFIKCGMTEKQVANELEFYMKHQAAEKTSFDTIVATGERAALPHAVPTEKEIQKGDLLLMDYGCIVDGYCSDMTRTVAIGEISQDKQKIYDIVLKAQLASLKALKSGENGKDIDKIARDVITNEGYGKNFGHSLGHGVGLEIHEEPRLSPTSPYVLTEGMVVTVEPGIYVEGLCGVRIEDMVYVTRDGYHNFISSPKELVTIRAI